MSTSGHRQRGAGARSPVSSSHGLTACGHGAVPRGSSALQPQRQAELHDRVAVAQVAARQRGDALRAGRRACGGARDSSAAAGPGPAPVAQIGRAACRSGWLPSRCVVREHRAEHLRDERLRRRRRRPRPARMPRKPSVSTSVMPPGPARVGRCCRLAQRRVERVDVGLRAAAPDLARRATRARGRRPRSARRASPVAGCTTQYTAVRRGVPARPRRRRRPARPRPRRTARAGSPRASVESHAQHAVRLRLGSKPSRASWRAERALADPVLGDLLEQLVDARAV